MTKIGLSGLLLAGTGLATLFFLATAEPLSIGHGWLFAGSVLGGWSLMLGTAILA